MARVALISMPFAPYERPSIQLGILKALLSREGVASRDYYFNIDFFELLYRERLTSHYTSSTAALIYEWYFSERSFSPRPGTRDFLTSFRLKDYARSRGLLWADMLRIRRIGRSIIFSECFRRGRGGFLSDFGFSRGAFQLSRGRGDMEEGEKAGTRVPFVLQRRLRLDSGLHVGFQGRGAAGRAAVPSSAVLAWGTPIG